MFVRTHNCLQTFDRFSLLMIYNKDKVIPYFFAKVYFIMPSTVLLVAMSSISRFTTASCPVCGRSMPIRKDGNIWLHGPTSARCSGSGLPPAVLIPSATVGSPSPSSNVTLSSSPSTLRSEDSSTLGPLNPGRAAVNVLGRIP